MALDEELDLPRTFGPYTLVRRLAVGGMAEVYVAKTSGISGFEKLVAIKVIHPRYSEDDHFVQMLVEEAKITVLLNHVNIAQTFDLGCIDDTYYIVMELIEGADAYRVIRRVSEMKRALPLDLAAFIAAEVCNGLDYAHRKKDPNGRSLGIVHRDVSPQNILISYAGEVKVVDFGIAKAALRSGQTDAGVIKGKYYYMSPEQAWGDPIDHRSDIFSAGVCLYELLTSRMLYTEENVPLLLDKVRKAEIAPPETRRKSVPKALSDIVMRALQRDPAERYQSAGEMQQALMHFIYSISPAFTASRLAEAMGTLFPNEVQRHSAIVKLPSVEEPLEPRSQEPSSAHAARSPSSRLAEEEEDEMTRNDVLPFRRKKELAAKAPPSTESPELEEPLRATFRPPSMKYAAVPEEPTAPSRRHDTGTDRIEPPKIATDGSWLHPAPYGVPATSPEAASEDVTNDTHAQAEWDDPTKLKGARDDWEEDATLVDSEGLAAAIDLVRAQTSGASQLKSERGKVNLQPIPRQPARLGQQALVAQPRALGKPASVPPPPGAAAWGTKSPPKTSEAPAASKHARAHMASSQSLDAQVSAHARAPAQEAMHVSQRPPSSTGEERAQAAPVSVPGRSSEAPSLSGATGVQAVSSAHAQPPSSAAMPPRVTPASSNDPLAAELRGDLTQASSVEPQASGRRSLGIAISMLAAIGLVVAVLAVALGGSVPPAIEIISAPTGAQVSIDGRVLPGTTPITCTEALEPGRAVRVEVTMPGFRPWVAELTPNEGTLRQFVVLVPQEATLRVETEPPGAEIMVQGHPRGISPVEVGGFLAGHDIEVRAALPGRSPAIRQVHLGEGTTTERIVLVSP